MQKVYEEKVVDDRPLRERITYPPSQTEEKYPYDDWLDGSVWKLKMYEDFFVHPKSMRQAIYGAVNRRNLKVRVHMPTTQDCLYIQVVKDD